MAVARHGAGTERLEHDLREALGDAGFPVFRLDADAAARQGRVATTLARFEAAPAGVLVGTQMVAKGHDFADVTLGVVLDADQTLRFPDFRAEERTFALITQLAGRAGRGGAVGRVLVQTLAPAARSIGFASRHDSEGFLADELGRRKALSYPPYGSLIRVVCSAIEPEAADATAASALRDRIEPPGTSVLGPAPLFRLRGPSRAASWCSSRPSGGRRSPPSVPRSRRSDRTRPGAGSTSASTSIRSDQGRSRIPRTRLKSVAEQAQDQLEEQPEDELEEEAPQLDPEVAARRAAALAHVRKFGDPVLRTKARPVDRFDDTLRSEIERMGHLMHDSLGVGLAATQVGTLQPRAGLSGAAGRQRSPRWSTPRSNGRARRPRRWRRAA